MTTVTDTKTTTQVYRVYIKATPQAVWDAITRPEWSEQYGYGGHVEFDLRPGGRHRALTSDAMKAGGKAMGYEVPDVAVDGEVLEVDPPHRLVVTWRMAMDEEMAAEGFTRLTYEIEQTRSGVTRLTLVHDLEGAPKLAVMLAGGMEEEGAGGGWSWVLSSLKTLLETGAALDPDDPMVEG
jgi:uncharacterized protein YndB with AHSA1/START domain